jgi:hypothetical protein
MKIPTIFHRDENFKIMPQLRDECGWILTDDHVVFEKLDGTNVCLVVHNGALVRILRRRRKPSAEEKALGLRHRYWYVPCHKKHDRWVLEAAMNTDVTGWENGPHRCEAMGPRIQANPLKLQEHICVRHADVRLEMENIVLPRDTLYFFDILMDHCRTLESQYSPGNLAEGLIFTDFRRYAKVKCRDFDYTEGT